MAGQAPVGILVCGDLRLDTCQGYWVPDCSNCAMNMLLAAHAWVWELCGRAVTWASGCRAFAPCAACLPG